ncbi:hypothetical protein CDAR_564371 [Caerostris darwini]|uniref:Uncharacterized protein n=1 Tax=Caerostris darwini TaxID=1538125 RepID=A0AAV4TGF5_9ARAC|nr:hypothetical protein CDAR_564371 [Caerostris darwini]
MQSDKRKIKNKDFTVPFILHPLVRYSNMYTFVPQSIPLCFCFLPDKYFRVPSICSKTASSYSNIKILQRFPIKLPAHRKHRVGQTQRQGMAYYLQTLLNKPRLVVRGFVVLSFL